MTLLDDFAEDALLLTREPKATTFCPDKEAVGCSEDTDAAVPRPPPRAEDGVLAADCSLCGKISYWPDSSSAGSYMLCGTAPKLLSA